MQSQQLEDVIAGLEATWAFFGGMPKYLVIDNFPAAVVGADPLHPRFTQGFLEYAQHRGFIPDPARAGHPKDKPRVERNVPYARERFFKGADFDDFTHVRAAAPSWCLEVAGMRIHGATRKQPRVVFQDEERHTLLPWTCCLGMVSPTTSPTGARPRYIRIITSSVSRRSTRRRRSSARRVGRWR